jgi:hypothetical protein
MVTKPTSLELTEDAGLPDVPEDAAEAELTEEARPSVEAAAAPVVESAAIADCCGSMSVSVSDA